MDRAETCFKRASLLQPRRDKRACAVVMQNIGAVCNVQRRFIESIEHHEAAVNLYGGEREGERDLFSNNSKTIVNNKIHYNQTSQCGYC